MVDDDVQMLTMKAADGKYFIRVKNDDPWHEISKEVWEMLHPYTLPGYPPGAPNA